MAGNQTDSRFEALRSAPPNSWVALSEDEQTVVAVGATYDEAVTKSQQAGVSDPVLLKTPETWASFSL